MVAYYAHSQGNGHFNSAQLFVNEVYTNTIILSCAHKDGKNLIRINNEDTTPKEYVSAIKNIPKYAHYLPKNNLKIAERTKQIVDVILDYQISLAMIDVSVETAAIFRLASIPYGYCLLPGNRTDNAHRIAFDAADFLFSYLPEYIFKHIPDQFKEKTFFLGFTSKFTFRNTNCLIESEPNLEGKTILILCGNGGTKIDAEIIDKICNVMPECTVNVVGNINGWNQIINGNYLGYVQNVEQYIVESDIVISSCGVNLTSEILAIKNKFIAIAEERPYNEQIEIQKALTANNLAIAFDINNIRNCFLQFLRLKPPINLANSFCNKPKIEKLTKKIMTYEKQGHFVDYHLS
jgi:UDP-N-acetylglucosamine:LPS N-acetylglucosamine transferase